MAITDAPVAAQYESWVYPKPIPDMAEAVTDKSYYDASDPSIVRRKLWPRPVEPDDLDILVAGCGSNQAAYLALANPRSRVIGIDLSSASLAHEQYLKEKHDLHNLELRQMELEQACNLGGNFDLIVSTGVLHHLPDPAAGLRALAGVLRPHGVMSIMLYGAYPRVGVNMLQEAFRLIGLQQDAAGVQLVRHTLERIAPSRHHVVQYVKNDRDVTYDAGLVDTFLHAREQAYTVADIMTLIANCELKFQGWLDGLDYCISFHIYDPHDPLRQAIEALPPVDHWRCVELIGQAMARQFFLVCHADRPDSDFTLKFSGDDWLDYVPSVRIGLHVQEDGKSGPSAEAAASGPLVMSRFGHRVELNAFESALFRRIDGRRTILEILDDDAIDLSNPMHQVQGARDFFQRMAGWDHVLFQIP